MIAKEIKKKKKNTMHNLKRIFMLVSQREPKGLIPCAKRASNDRSNCKGFPSLLRTGLLQVARNWDRAEIALEDPALEHSALPIHTTISIVHAYEPRFFSIPILLLISLCSPLIFILSLSSLSLLFPPPPSFLFFSTPPINFPQSITTFDNFLLFSRYNMFLRLVSAASCASCCRLIVTVISRPRVHAYITSLEIGTGSRTLYEEKASLSSTSLFSFFSPCSLIRLFFPPLFFLRALSFLSPLLLPVVLSLSSSSHPPHPFPPITVSLIFVHRRKRQLEGRFPYARWISHDCIIGCPVPLLHTPGFLFHPLFHPGSSDLQFLGESINMQNIDLSFFFSRFVTSNRKFIISRDDFTVVHRVDHRPRQPRAASLRNLAHQYARPSFSTALTTASRTPPLISVTPLGHHLLSGDEERGRTRFSHGRMVTRNYWSTWSILSNSLNTISRGFVSSLTCHHLEIAQIFHLDSTFLHFLSISIFQKVHYPLPLIVANLVSVSLNSNRT